MIKKLILFAACIALMASGCTKHTFLADRTLKVGNIYCSDGSVMDPDTYKSEGRDNAAGVVFWVNDTLDTENKAYIVSLIDAEKGIWCDTLVSTGVSTSITEYNGAANTAMLQAFEVRAKTRVPAMNIAVYFSDGIIIAKADCHGARNSDLFALQAKICSSLHTFPQRCINLISDIPINQHFPLPHFSVVQRFRLIHPACFHRDPFCPFRMVQVVLSPVRFHFPV